MKRGRLQEHLAQVFIRNLVEILWRDLVQLRDHERQVRLARVLLPRGRLSRDFLRVLAPVGRVELEKVASAEVAEIRVERQIFNLAPVDLDRLSQLEIARIVLVLWLDDLQRDIDDVSFIALGR